MIQNNFYFWALEPEPSFYDLVMKKKSILSKVIGEQPYCEDPPHTTIYLSAFSDELMLQKKTEKALHTIKSIINIKTNGWHIFYADPLTGNNTLVIDLLSESINQLRRMQLLIVNDLQEFRDKDRSLLRYSPFFNNFDKAKINNTINFGFPFIGDVWQPHVTIASIKEDLWETAWDLLCDTTIPKAFLYSALVLYRLEGSLPKKVQSFSLSSEDND